MRSENFFKKLANAFSFTTCFILLANTSFSQRLTINDFGYFEKPGVNVFVFNGQYNGMFFDEKTGGIELIHQGVRTATGGFLLTASGCLSLFLPALRICVNHNQSGGMLKALVEWRKKQGEIVGK